MPVSQHMKIVPINFSRNTKALLEHCKMISETDGRGRKAMNTDGFEKLITALRTAMDNDRTLDKGLLITIYLML
jgi:hypothetical protein